MNLLGSNQYFEDKYSGIQGNIVIAVECCFCKGSGGIFCRMIFEPKLSKEANHVLSPGQSEGTVKCKGPEVGMHEEEKAGQCQKRSELGNGRKGGQRDSRFLCRRQAESN